MLGMMKLQTQIEGDVKMGWKYIYARKMYNEKNRYTKCMPKNVCKVWNWSLYIRKKILFLGKSSTGTLIWCVNTVD